MTDGAFELRVRRWVRTRERVAEAIERIAEADDVIAQRIRRRLARVRRDGERAVVSRDWRLLEEVDAYLAGVWLCLEDLGRVLHTAPQ